MSSETLIGYHYTSAENWASIKKEGLKPYSIKKMGLIPYFGTKSISGIWMWRSRQFGISHAGSIIFQIGTKATSKVVLIALKYKIDDCLHYEEEGEKCLVTLHHDGFIENYQYHQCRECEKACILTRPILAKDIELVNAYCLADAWDY